MIRDKKTGRFIVYKDKPFDKKEYDREYYKKHYVSKGGYQKGENHHLWKGGKKDHCPKCNTLKYRDSKVCRKCMGVSYRGEGSPRWKGGYVNTKRLAKVREARILENGGSHTLVDWEQLKMKYGYMCLCCKKTEPEIVLQRDHIVPVSKGGTSNIENIQPLCQSCNSRKKTKILNFIIQYA